MSLFYYLLFLLCLLPLLTFPFPLKMFFRVQYKDDSKTVIAHLTFKEGMVTLVEFDSAEFYGHEPLTPRDIYQSDLYLTIAEGDLEILDRIYIVSAGCFLSMEAWPENVFCGRRCEYPLDDACAFIAASREFRKAVHKGITFTKEKARVSVRLTEEEFDSLFDQEPFYPVKRGIYLAEALFVPSREGNQQRNIMFLASLTGTLSEARTLMDRYQRGDLQAIQLQRGEVGKIRRRVAKIPSPGPREQTQVKRLVRVDYDAFQVMLGQEELRQLEKKIGPFLHKKKDGFNKFQIQGPAKAVYNKTAGKLTFSFCFTNLF